MRDQIDFEEPVSSTCDCCGNQTIRLTRFVQREGAAFAVYFAVMTDGDHGGHVGILASFGNWQEDADPTDRTAFAMRIWTSKDFYQVGLVDPDDDGWTTDFLGKKLTRSEALDHPLKPEAFLLSDHIVECDVPIIKHLNLH